MLAKFLSAAIPSTVPNPAAWDLSYASYGGGELDISTAIFVNSRSISAEELAPAGVFFKPDGTKMYVVGAAGDEVNEYSLSTPWNPTSETFVQSFSVSAQDGAPNDLFFKPDGTKMYVVGGNNDSVYEYTLSTAWDVSTASYVQSFSAASQDTLVEGLSFKPDGTKMYVVGRGNDSVYEYTLSTAWDVSTASYVQSFSVAAQDPAPTSISFSTGGTKMCILGDGSNSIYEYTLSTAWDISSASYVQSFSVAAQDTTPDGIYVKEDNSLIFIAGSTGDTIDTFLINSFDVGSVDADAQDIFFKDDGTKMYICGLNGTDIHEYTLSTAWDVSSASYSQSLFVNAQEGDPEGLFFKPDGTKMYICGTQSNEINEYSLSTAWDISTASFVQLLSVSGRDDPYGLFFKPDGTKMYIATRSDNIDEYALSTAWDISTASFSGAVAVTASEPHGVFFKSDGTKMFVTYKQLPVVEEYSLSTPWVVTSGTSYVRELNLLGGDRPSGLFFKPDGLALYIVDTNTDAVTSYILSE